MSLEQEISDGARADRLMKELSPFMGMVKEAIIEKWEASPVADREGQHELRLMLKLLNDLQANIKTTIETGKMAQIQIEQESKLTKFKRAVGF